jgi:adenylosuccinate lyase
MIGRTHGVHAEPTTFGLVLLGYVTELRRQQLRLREAFAGVEVGKLSGAVGTYANSEPRIEEFALGRLALDREQVATQVIPRDRHANLLSALAGAGSSLDRFATEIRHLIATGTTERELLVKVARRFPDLTSAELSEALQDATAAAERSVRAKH